MPIAARKINRGLLILMAASTTVFAQSNPPNAPAPAAGSVPSNNAAPANAPAPQQSGTGDSSTSAALDYLYNHKPKEGSVADQASQANEAAKDRAIAADAVGLSAISDPQLRARFEKYIGMSEVTAADLAAYKLEIQKVSALLQNNRIFDAWKELREMGRFQAIDAGVSIALADRIESMWNTDKAPPASGEALSRSKAYQQ